MGNFLGHPLEPEPEISRTCASYTGYFPQPVERVRKFGSPAETVLHQAKGLPIKPNHEDEISSPTLHSLLTRFLSSTLLPFLFRGFPY